MDAMPRNTGTHVTNHFCQPGHSDSSLRCMPIEQLLSSPEDTSRRRRREFFWMTKLSRKRGTESLANSDQDSKLGFVVNAVKTMALALHDMHSDLCPRSVGLCQEMNPINGTLFLEYLLNVSFASYSGHVVHFDEDGDPPGRYEILNYQPVIHADGNVTYEYVTIGQWMTGNLAMNDNGIYWPGKGRNPDKPFYSVCSQPCGPGFVKQGVGSDGLTCCWVCTPCQDTEIVVDEAHCSPCDLGWWPSDNKTDCEEIAVEFVSWLDTWSLVVVGLGSVGLLFTAWVTTIFIRSHNTPVVKASTRELSYILLLGIALAFSCNFLLVSKPAPFLCYLNRIVPGLAFSLMYGALVTRTNRIARILEGSKRIMTKKPRFMSATAQVIITIIIIAIECVIISAMLVLEPADSEMDYSLPKRVRLVCNTSTLGIIVPLGFDLFLIFMCTLYAVKTRNLPENFNEAKFIGFTMYTTCVIWLGFFPIYFGGQNYQEATLSISISLSAAIALVLLFFPKVYIIVWAPEKNTRGAFTTSKDVRCHIGSKSIQSTDSVEFSGLDKKRHGVIDDDRPVIRALGTTDKVFFTLISDIMDLQPCSRRNPPVCRVDPSCDGLDKKRHGVIDDDRPVIRALGTTDKVFFPLISDIMDLQPCSRRNPPVCRVDPSCDGLDKKRHGVIDDDRPVIRALGTTDKVFFTLISDIMDLQPCYRHPPPVCRVDPSCDGLDQKRHGVIDDDRPVIRALGTTDKVFFTLISDIMDLQPCSRRNPPVCRVDPSCE
ncbi:hypothetical protein ACOMHN_023187 [Nucella lapillus]